MDGNKPLLPWERAYPDALKKIEKSLLAQRRSAPQQSTDPQQSTEAHQGTGASKIAEAPNEVPKDVGFALSGGGIRSATFCLGIFQGLGKQKLLSKIDYLSTVSGGGYFGSFYGRLFTREEVANITDVREILAACSASDVQDSPPESPPAPPPGSPPAPKKFPIGKVFRWLRDNGRYLAPRGAGGILLDSAVMMRNWTALQLVLATLMLMVFLLVQSVRGIVEVTWQGTWWWKNYEDILVHPPWGTYIWWSPYAIAPVLAFLILVVPPAWSYWLVEKPELGDVPKRQWISPWVGLIFTALLAITGVIVGWRWEIPHYFYFCLVVFAVTLLTAGWFGVNRSRLARVHKHDKIRNSEEIRNHLSVQLKFGLVLTGCLLGFVVLDSLAQTAYAANLVGIHGLGKWAASVFGTLTVAAGFGRSIFVALGSKADGKRISVPWSAAAGIAAVLVAATLLITFDVCSYAIAWQGALPVEEHPHWVHAAKPEPGKLFKVVRQASGNYLIKHIPAATGKAETVFNVVKQGPENQAAETWAVQNPPAPDENKKDGTKKNCAPVLSIGSRDDYPGLWRLWAALAIALVFSFLFGWSWPFLNRSTLHPLYTSRLIRAYLGASNPRRLLGTKGGDVTEVVAGDDLKQEQYWALHPPGAQRGFFDSIKARFRRKGSENKQGTIAPGIYAKGGPLHLVNVTINETAGGRSAVEQLDRKGVGMAIGPAAISAGVCHHVVFERKDGQPPVKVYPELSEKNAFRMFGDADSFQGERLSLGNWMGVSGAAISTGLGSRTSLGASFLAGWANIRLGYWWNSGVDPKMRNQAAPSSLLGQVSVKAANWVASVFSMQAFFAMQTFLLNEFSARFYGPACQWWYLTDGGHFENMGGYELIRRRLPIMVIVDAEADPDYSFEGMANLVRKARLDFGAEIEFLSEESLDTFVDVSLRGYFGTPEQLRRGRWVEEPVEVPGAPPRDPGKQRPKRRVINPPDEAALSRAYASLAVVSYTDHAAPNSLLLYVKPTLIGAEPVDVRRYH
ncbi:MAG: hypothetical protein ACLQSH_01815, partial [Candidatus Binatus sp.]